MLAIDEQFIPAPPGVCFQVAADVERWPEILPHYRWVRFLAREAFGTGRVEMAAWRPFGPIGYPTWWVSEMHVAEAEPAVYYRHIDGITTGMDVKWSFTPERDGTRARIVHEWSGPPWPLIGRFAAEHIIGPHFVSAIAQRTLAGVARECEHRARAAATDSGAAPAQEKARG